VKVVLDTNVLISGIFFSGPPHEILNAWRKELIQIVLSPEILDEYQEVARRLVEKYPSIELIPILKLIATNSELVHAAKLASPVCDDPDDDKFIACALASQSKVIISGDRHLLKKSGFRGILILSPSSFTRQYLHKK
jgi:uncharacterized protein